MADAAKEKRRLAKQKWQNKDAPVAAKGNPFAKALVFGGKWDVHTFEDFPLVVYWIRQVVGIALGIVWGIIPLTGWQGILRCVCQQLWITRVLPAHLPVALQLQTLVACISISTSLPKQTRTPSARWIYSRRVLQIHFGCLWCAPCFMLFFRQIT
jgi:hypothetical protein